MTSLVPRDDAPREVAEVLRLRREEGLTVREIAERVGRSKSHVGRIVRAGEVSS